MTAIEMYQKYFPHARPSILQMEYIEGHVTDLNVWAKACEWWALNDYRAQSVFKIVEYYKGECNGSNQKFGKRSDQQTIAESADFYDNWNH